MNCPIPSFLAALNDRRLCLRSTLFSASLQLVLLVLLSGSIATAQDRAPRRQRGNKGFDAAKFLQRLDRNNDEILDTSEMVGNTASYLQGLGFDTSKPISLNVILRKFENKQKNGKSAEPNKSSVVRKVPGFGIEKPEGGEIARFGVTGSPGQAIDMNAKYGERIMKLVERTLEGYDQNKNGVLDPPEILRARWGNPKPEVSDRNHDGVLSLVELADRYLARDRDSKSSNRGGNSFSSRSVRPPSAEEIKSKNRNYVRSRARATTPVTNRGNSSRANKTPTRSSPSSNKNSFNSGTDRYARYAKGLMTQYDENKDGKLDKGELGKMRRPPKNADINGDGFVTSQELTDTLSGKSKTPSTPTVTPVTPGQQNGQQTDHAKSTGRSTSRTTRRLSSSFSELDSNQDGQVQMSEFTDEWDGEVFSQFQAKDLNGDGVITSDEWNGR